MDYQANYKKQVDALRNEVKEVDTRLFLASHVLHQSFLHLEFSLQVDEGHGAILNNLRQQIHDRAGAEGWQYQVF